MPNRKISKADKVEAVNAFKSFCTTITDLLRSKFTSDRFRQLKIRLKLWNTKNATWQLTIESRGKIVANSLHEDETNLIERDLGLKCMKITETKNIYLIQDENFSKLTPNQQFYYVYYEKETKKRSREHDERSQGISSATSSWSPSLQRLKKGIKQRMSPFIQGTSDPRGVHSNAHMDASGGLHTPNFSDFSYVFAFVSLVAWPLTFVLKKLLVFLGVYDVLNASWMLMSGLLGSLLSGFSILKSNVKKIATNTSNRPTSGSNHARNSHVGNENIYDDNDDDDDDDDDDDVSMSIEDVPTLGKVIQKEKNHHQEEYESYEDDVYNNEPSSKRNHRASNAPGWFESLQMWSRTKKVFSYATILYMYAVFVLISYFILFELNPDRYGSLVHKIYS